MPRYLLKIKYSVQGLNGVRKEGGTARAEVARKLIEGVGGKLETFDFAFGEYDAFAVIEAPSNAAVAGAATIVGAAGGASVETVALMTAAEIDEAVRTEVAYRAPGT
ncbi:MAG TPA: GYD domain-containing protein [Candidatus Dormibacteraeota bacterium]|jgi:uncharacterized protein with GYD domain